MVGRVSCRRLFLVGGPVRDALLGRALRDLDFMITGASAEELTQAWGEPTGQVFPVWRVHPIGWAEPVEVAAARREVKAGVGHRGFRVEFGPEVTVEADLHRRDLTINSISLLVWEGDRVPRAEDPAWEEVRKAVDAFLTNPWAHRDRIVDPFGGLEDLKAGVLRAPDPGVFAEDPLRVLRLARFRARFGFRVDPGTLEAARRVVFSGELQTLSAERVWMEWVKVSKAKRPDLFLQTLHELGALEQLPGLGWLAKAARLGHAHHQESQFEHALLVVRAAAALLEDPRVVAPVAPGTEGAEVVDRVKVITAALFHDLGKTLVPAPEVSCVGHDQFTSEVQAQLTALRAPARIAKAAALWAEIHMKVHGVRRPGKVLAVFQEGLSRFTPTELGILAGADTAGRVPFDLERGIEEALRVRRLAELTQQVLREVTGAAVKSVKPGPEFGRRLHALRAARLAVLM